eukprot:TRINITY_DN1327_c0_g1_i1.p1 TRINITY_DN1327_c0_g1~~TRINITY_DN1327_c0_g1_i1.p1  ORF type:complete len:251 (-),score=50.83 TRINITY_DN1327_c0_g1_i1:131-841(-)
MQSCVLEASGQLGRRGRFEDAPDLSCSSYQERVLPNGTPLSVNGDVQSPFPKLLSIASTCDSMMVMVKEDDDELQWLRKASTILAKKIIVQTKRLPTHLKRRYHDFLKDPLFDPSAFAVKFIRRARVSPSVVLLGYFYLHRILEKHSKLKMTSINASRLMVVACTCAAKFLDDQAMRYTNKHWVHIAGGWISLGQFNQMEREFLSLLNFDLSVNLPAFYSFCAKAGATPRDLTGRN